ncbi:hypothetical protein [Mycobacterium intracellulare]|uniref:DUF7427 family protein n=1 Tax=Mycobacterium intracellulare TaxID=1767 RepID=UPI000BAC2511|nr:hypothetical protein [Mycobacterium intracellulare]ASX01110.1 hypothetical protein CKJ58_15075 [Mycobacterium intracellulare subsp. chimaera]PBA60700.1 hypothetical protein CKJ56_15245 [Mycobacterium intracellulare subsp. chimaera]
METCARLLAAAGLLIIAIVYNVFIAEDGCTLSETFDGYIERWPWLKPAILMRCSDEDGR